MTARPSDEAVSRALNQMGIATLEQIEAAQREQVVAARSGQPIALGDVLVEQGIITPATRDNIEKKLMAQQQGGVQQLGNYKLIKKLGEGGMGAVYLAEDTTMLRKVALKVLTKKFASDRDFLQRFRREAKAAGKLNHVNIISAFTVGEELGNHFYVMEYCEGESLDAVLKREKVLSWDRAIEITIQVARGLQHAHEQGLIHRDIKPANILLASNASPAPGSGADQSIAKILDMGLSKDIGNSEQSFTTQTGVALGTPHYISPEQAKGEKNVDGRTDIYSLGATLYHLVTGQTPFEGSTAAMVIMKHLTDQIPNPQDIREDVPDSVVQVIQKMMAKETADRYSDCAELLADLELVIDGKMPGSNAIDVGKSSIAMPRAALRRAEVTPRKGPAGLLSRASRSPEKKKSTALVAGGAILVLGMLIFIATSMKGGSTPPAKPPTQPSDVATHVDPPQPPITPPELKPVVTPTTASTNPPQLPADTLTGAWSGVYFYAPPAAGEAARPATTINVTFELRGTALSGQIREPRTDFGPADAKELVSVIAGTHNPATGEVLFTKTYELTREQVMYKGRLTGAEITGTWTLKDLTGSFLLRRNVASEKVDDPARWKDAIDLMRLIEIWRDAASGVWKQNDGGIVSDNFGNLKAGAAVLKTPYVPPEEYDFRITFTRLEGNYEVIQFAQVPARSFAWVMGGGANTTFSIPNLGGNSWNDNPSVVKLPSCLENARQYSSVVQVRRDGVKAWLNGKLITQFATPYSNMTLSMFWVLSDVLGIGSYASSTQFHSIQVLEISGPGTLTRPEEPTAKEAKKKQDEMWSKKKAVVVVPDTNLPKELSFDLGNGVKMEMVLVTPGEFMMGDDNGNTDEKPAHKVRISQPYYIGKYKVTVAQFRRFAETAKFETDCERAGNKGWTVKDGKWQETTGINWKAPGFKQEENHPVVLVSWNDLQAFNTWASRLTGRDVRLPTEAQWEYAAHGTESKKYPWGDKWDGALANHGDVTLKNTGFLGGCTNDNDGFAYTSPVGNYKNTTWCGTFDMAGNAWEWVNDKYQLDYYAKSPGIDPPGAEGTHRVFRGGSWQDTPADCRAARRYFGSPDNRSTHLGFRVAAPAVSKAGTEMTNPKAEITALPKETTLDLGNGVKLETVLVPAGEFMMGSDNFSDEEKPAHKIKISKPFYAGKFEVSVAQFRAFVESAKYKPESEQLNNGWTVRGGKWSQLPDINWKNPGFKQLDTHPVVVITWNDAQAFCKWASALKSLEGKWTVRLPTEAEWEYIARGTNPGVYPWGNAWGGTTSGNAGDASLRNTGYDVRNADPGSDTFPFTAPVGSFKKGASWCGAFDLAGNAFEWCEDKYDPQYYRVTPAVDPPGAPAGEFRCLRGGAWNQHPEFCRSTFRNKNDPGCVSADYGFRVVVSAAKQP